MTQPDLSLDRRRFVLGSSGAVLAASLGCSARSDAVPEEMSEERTDVPLRVLLVGSDEEAESLQRGWQAVSEQPLKVQVIPRDRADAGKMASETLNAVLQTDVLIYPLALVAQLHADDSITMLAEEEFEEIEQQGSELLPALRNGAARYAADFVGVPQGAPLPALLSAAPLPESFEQGSIDWSQYHTLVDEHWNGSAAEPTAPGWAGSMFLWRAASSTSWLFDRQTFEPLIAESTYVSALEQMRQTHALYQGKARTPDAIWNGVTSGQLKGGIGFPAGPADEESVSVNVLDLPRSESLARVLLDPFSPVASLSINCRQSATAKRFIAWLSGGEGSSQVRQQMEHMTPIRSGVSATTGMDDSVSAAGAADLSYQRWLALQLSSPLLLPTLQIRRGADYYQVLDEQITATLEGQTEPNAALKEVADAWQSMTREIGIDKQLRAWRRAQGMRG